MSEPEPTPWNGQRLPDDPNAAALNEAAASRFIDAMADPKVTDGTGVTEQIQQMARRNVPRTGGGFTAMAEVVPDDEVAEVFANRLRECINRPGNSNAPAELVRALQAQGWRVVR